MASRFLISVGGSGQHIALAMTRLVYMGALKNDIRLIAIDPDNKLPISDRLQSPAGLAGDRHPLKSGQVHTPFDVSKLGEKSFSKMFVDEQNPEEREMFEAMFEQPMDEIPVHKGMYGNPCVGATVFAEGAQNNSFKNILAPVQNATEVVVCGSVVGGTGAGITHKLITEVRKHYNEPKDMFGIFMLPWFKVQSGVTQAGAINDQLIQRNASHGIKYFYEQTIPALTSSALVGFPEGQKSKVLSEMTVTSSDMGQEKPHYLHLVACFAFAKLKASHTANHTVKAYYVSHHLDNEGWMLDEKWEDGACLVGSGGADNIREEQVALTLRIRVRAHQVLLNLLRFLTDEKQRREFLDYYKHSIIGFASRAWSDDFDKSVSNAEPSKSLHRGFIEEVLKEFAQIASEVHLCVDWAQTIFDVDMLRLPHGDEQLDKLTRGAADQWTVVNAMWKGKTIAPLASGLGKITGAQVARSYAKFILDAALAPQKV